MKVVIVCQTRLGSTRLPGKVLLPLAGQPLIVRFMERIRRSKYGKEAVIATTTEPADDRLADLCTEYGLTVLRGHPTDLLDRHYQVGVAMQADIIVKIPSDCPMIDPHVVDRVIDEHLANRHHVDYTSNLHPATYPDGNDVEVMSMPLLRLAWKRATRPYEREHTTPWMWDDNLLVSCANVLWDGGKDYSMKHRWTVDYPEDYVFVKAVYDELYPSRPEFGIEDVLQLLEARPEIASLNAHLAGVNWYRDHLHALRTVDASRTRQAPPLSAA